MAAGGVEHHGVACVEALLAVAEVHVAGVSIWMPEWRWWSLYQSKTRKHKLALAIDANLFG